MFTRKKRWAVLIVVGVFGAYLSPASAEEITAPAFGTAATTLVCDKTPDGLTIAAAVELFRTKLNISFEINEGDACLSTLAKFPPSSISLRTSAQLNANGNGTIAAQLGFDEAGERIGGLTWMRKGPGYVEVLECNLNAQGNRLEVAYREDNLEGVDKEAEHKPCLETLASSETAERQLAGSVPVPVHEQDVFVHYSAIQAEGF